MIFFLYFRKELVDLSILKNDLWKLIGIMPINGLQHHNVLMNQSTYIPTGIKRFHIQFATIQFHFI